MAAGQDAEPEGPVPVGGTAEPAGSQESPATGSTEPEGGTAEREDGTAEQGKGKRSKGSFLRDMAVIVVAALVLTSLLKTFVVQVFSIPSGSMENTLRPGDRILVSKIVYRFRSIDRGDIVVFSGAGSWDPPAQSPGNWFVRAWDEVIGLVGIAGPGTDYVKRVIGLPGDHVVCCNAKGQLTVNGTALAESSYLYPGASPSEVPFNITVPPGRLWVMGDNRGNSEDSRYRTNDPGGGTIPESAVVGRVFLIIWPLSRVTDLPIPNTFKQAAFGAAAVASTGPPVTVAGGAFFGAAALTWRRRRRRGRGHRPGAG